MTPRALVREPLVQFLLLGGTLFLYSGWRGSGSSRINVSTGQIEHLAAGFARTWQRPPSEAEMKGLVDDYVKEEIATREAIAMGLDRDDTVIRRRLRQKLEFLVEEDASLAAPTDAELQAWLDAHPESFASEPRVAFRQVFVSPERRGAAARPHAEALVARLSAAGPGAATGRLGDPSMLPAEQELAPLGEAARAFGQEFATTLVSLEPLRWTGPIESPYGLHVVLVRERAPAARPALAEVRPLVERELLAERKKTELQQLYERLLQKYPVSIEGRPEAAAKAAAPAAGSR
ncbi:MAG: peptidyl-prolyl cis-trans isomerase [Burkholderiales bacterium]